MSPPLPPVQLVISGEKGPSPLSVLMVEERMWLMHGRRLRTERKDGPAAVSRGGTEVFVDGIHNVVFLLPRPCFFFIPIVIM